ncbi:helix-turn-helix transcriptional regulator [Planomonospora sp. ID67723]|uniref:helix-turn-helix transcriptional regulator n=1 Tax=Planomonospora sp. ID67723 TaxID=2738134 RepID=UPI0018C3791A|nr:helix-turn-helix transcriptional regulator [Planomonospora sp. ID67723]MBG0830554.1 helix-turn-helix transcriptional regulator [Planomonospora sp. ID67723]
MKQREGRHDHAPGRPLWDRAEQERVRRGWTQEELADRAGISRVTFMRLKTQATSPRATTVNKLADAIGVSHEEAAELAGLVDQSVRGTMDVTLPSITGSLEGIAQQADPETARRIQALRDAGRALGRSLGDVLVFSGLATPDDLRLSQDPLVEELVNDPQLPDEVRDHLKDTYRRLRARV